MVDVPASNPSASKCRRLEGKQAVVTGAANGIGLAIARRLVAEGARVLMADRDARVEQVAAELDQPFCVVDLLETDGVAQLFDEVDRVLFACDILVNNAGIVTSTDLLEISPEEYDRVMTINARVPLFATQAAARRMMKQGGGAIVNISSVSGKLGLPKQIPYCMSKGAVNQLTTSTSVALASHGIRVNAVAPGSIATELALSVALNDEIRATVMSRTPMERFGTPEEIAAGVAFLASDDASYMTGQTIYIEGGRLSLNMVTNF